MKLKVNENGLPILDQFSEEGFIDCVLKIVDLEEGEDSYKFNLRASYSGDNLGFRVEVVKGIKGGFDSEMSLCSGQLFSYHPVGDFYHLNAFSTSAGVA